MFHVLFHDLLVEISCCFTCLFQEILWSIFLWIFHNVSHSIGQFVLRKYRMILFPINLMMFLNIFLDVFHEIICVIFHIIFHIVFQYFSLSRIQVASPSWLEVPCRESESVTGKPEGRAQLESHFQNSHKLLNYLFASVRTWSVFRY